MSLGPGRTSSEYWKTLRAEALGSLAFLGGSVFALIIETPERAAAGAFIAAAGAYVLAKANEAYAASRGNVKAAAVRRPNETSVGPKTL